MMDSEIVKNFVGFTNVKCEPSEFDIAEVFFGKDNKVAVFQMDAEYSGCFMRYQWFQEKSIMVESSLPGSFVFVGDGFLGNEGLESLFIYFNKADKPNGYKGRSMSVSDVVVINDGESVRAYYVQNIGFIEIPEFVEDYKESYVEHICIKDEGWVNLASIDLCKEYIAFDVADENSCVDLYAVNDRKLTKIISNILREDAVDVADRLNIQYGNYCLCLGIDDLNKIIRYKESTMVSACIRKILSVQEYMDALGLYDENSAIVETIGDLRTFLKYSKPYQYRCYEATEDMAGELRKKSEPCVLVFDGEQSAYFEIPVGTVERIRATEYKSWNQTIYPAVRIADRYITINGKDSSWEYAIYNAFYKQLGGGVRTELSAVEALNAVIKDLLALGGRVAGRITDNSIMIPVSFIGVQRRSVEMQSIQIVCTFGVCSIILQNNLYKQIMDDAIERFINGDYGRVSSERPVGIYNFGFGRELSIVNDGQYIIVGVEGQ